MYKSYMSPSVSRTCAVVLYHSVQSVIMILHNTSRVTRAKYIILHLFLI